MWPWRRLRKDVCERERERVVKKKKEIDPFPHCI